MKDSTYVCYTPSHMKLWTLLFWHMYNVYWKTMKRHTWFLSHEITIIFLNFPHLSYLLCYFFWYHKQLIYQPWTYCKPVNVGHSVKVKFCLYCAQCHTDTHLNVWYTYIRTSLVYKANSKQEHRNHCKCLKLKNVILGLDYTGDRLSGKSRDWHPERAPTTC